MNSGSSQTGQIRDALVRKDLCQLFEGIKTTIVVTVLRTVDFIRVLQAQKSVYFAAFSGSGSSCPRVSVCAPNRFQCRCYLVCVLSYLT